MALSSSSFVNKDNLTDIVGSISDAKTPPSSGNQSSSNTQTGQVTTPSGAVITLGDKGSYTKK